MLTNAELSILGLVLEEPRHGYAIEGVIEERGMREWTEVGFSSIYYILNKLEQGGLIQGRLEPTEGRGPARKVYSITPPGRAAWTEATLLALSEPVRSSSAFMLGLAGLPGLPRPEALRALNSYRRSRLENLERLKQTWKESVTDARPIFLEGMFSYTAQLAQAEVDWLGEFIARLEGERDDQA